MANSPNYPNAPAYTTIQDYVRLIRRQRWLILFSVLVFAGIGLAYSLQQEKEYTATGQIAFRDVTQDFGLLGSNVLPETQPPQRAAASAAAITRPEVVNQVKRRLGKVRGLTRDERNLVGVSVTTSVDTISNLVALTVTADRPRFAARVANMFAQETVRDQTRSERRRVLRAASALQNKVDQAELLGRKTPGGSLIRQELAQLETLANIAQPARIVEAAQPPAAPSAPRTKFNTFLAAMIGIVVGFALAFVRDALDRRLRAPRDVHDELDYPLLARVHDDTLGKSLTMPNGKGPASEADYEPFRMLRTNLDFLGNGTTPRSVMVTSGLPEEGKSTVALSLAATSALAGRRTLLVECDLRRPSLAKRLNLSEAPGLREYLADEATPADVVQTSQVTGPRAGKKGSAATAPLACITAGRSAPDGPELLASQRCRDFFEQVSEAYDLVVVDTGPLLAVVDPLQVVASVDGLLLCVRLSHATRDGARATRQMLERLPDLPTGVVVTGVKSGEDEIYGYYSYGSD